ncbi:IMP cyclohydrolase [Acidobacteriota bacterium]
MAESRNKAFSLEYPGRLIAIGRDTSGLYNVVIYAITGRSSSSQARKLEMEKDTLWVKPTDKDIIKTGNIELLIYPSVFVLEQGLAVSNGKHTVDIMASLGHSENASEVLGFSLQKWDYEPDEPNYTPRISGCVLRSGSAALSLIKRSKGGQSSRSIFEFPLEPGEGSCISTYSGVNRDPLPSYVGEPLTVDLNENDPQHMAEGVYEAMGPEEGKPDYRVAVACIFSLCEKPEEFQFSIINRSERNK